MSKNAPEILQVRGGKLAMSVSSILHFSGLTIQVFRILKIKFNTNIFQEYMVTCSEDLQLVDHSSQIDIVLDLLAILQLRNINNSSL